MSALSSVQSEDAAAGVAAAVGVDEKLIPRSRNPLSCDAAFVRCCFRAIRMRLEWARGKWKQAEREAGTIQLTIA